MKESESGLHFNATLLAKFKLLKNAMQIDLVIMSIFAEQILLFGMLPYLTST
jgi:hypothetical protein